jgi:hypothetical protein
MWIKGKERENKVHRFNIMPSSVSVYLHLDSGRKGRVEMELEPGSAE